MNTQTQAAGTEGAAGAPDTQSPDNQNGGQKKVPSLRDAVRNANTEVAAREAAGVTETEKAARVLRGESEEPPAQPPKPVKTTPDQPPAESKTAEAPEKAAAKKQAEQAPKPEAKAEDVKAGEEPAKKGPQRGPDGRFLSKTAEAAPEAGAQAPPAGERQDDRPADDPAARRPAERPAPQRFAREAQAEWDNTPEPVRRETERALGELERGLQVYREGAARMKSLEDKFSPALQPIGMNVEGALADYAGLSQLMGQDPLKALEYIAQRHGQSFEELAAKYLDIDPNETIAAAQGEVNELKKRNQALESDLSKAVRHIQQIQGQQQQQVEAQVVKFTETHPRFYELQPMIKGFLNSGMVDRSQGPAKALAEAYEMAERLRPAANTSPPPPPPPVPAATPQETATAQTELSDFSISGAPGPGSDPNPRKPASSVRDAVQKAARQTGVT